MRSLVVGNLWRQRRRQRRRYQVRVAQCRPNVQVAGSDRENIVVARVGDAGRCVDPYARRRELLGCRLHQAGLHLVGRQERVLLQQQSRGPAYHRRRHARAAKPHVGRSYVGQRRVIAQRNDRRGGGKRRHRAAKRRHDRVAGSDQVGFHDMIDQCRALGTVAGNQIVAPGRRTHVTHGAHRDHEGIVCWGGDHAIPAGTHRVVPSLITRRHNHHDPSLPCRFHGLVERIERITLHDRPAERQVDHANVVGCLQHNRPADCQDHRAVVAAAITIQHFQADDVRLRRDSPEGDRPGGIEYGAGAISRDNSRHVRAVPISTRPAGVGKGFAVHQTAGNAVGLEIGDGGHTAIDDGYPDSRPIPAVL